MSEDLHSFARPREARITHLSLDLDVDFERRVLFGTATLDLDVAEGAGRVVLDTRRLTIERVTDGAGHPLAHSIAAEDPVLGSALTVALPTGTRRLAIHYSTAPDAEGLQWLGPEQTEGGEHPFLFTQGHAIQSRSWIPLQDSPGIRLTYEARITVPAPLVAVMSAEHLGATPHGATTTFGFRMNEPIPAYLIALAAGSLASHAIGPRTAVFAEPAMIERAAHELSDMESMIDAAEALGGPYLWGRFDVVVMPPSFPYGGMENPRLVFASPSLIVGDRSLTTVIAHELAHAWAGNLVTNATWSDFWINEGTTVYLELRIHEALWGAERASMLQSWGWRELSAEIERMGATAPDTRLRYDMTARDPAEGVTVIPYLKGAAFFWTLEKVVGRPRLDAWLRSWFERRAFQSVTTETLLADLREHLFAASPSDALPVDLEHWVSHTGVPEGAAPTPSALLLRVDEAARAVSAGAALGAIDVQGWTPQAWRHFLGTLLAARPDVALVEALDDAFRLSESHNPEVLLPWLRLEAQVQRESSVPRIERFLRGQGRSRYLRPLYGDLLATAWGAPIARRVYGEARPKYHALVRTGLDRLFAITAG
jgi:aminopeptidase N